MESPENGGACFPPFPQTLEIARRVHQEMKIKRSDFHIPSAPGRDDEYNSSFKTRKDKNPASPTLRFLQAHPWIGKDYVTVCPAKSYMPNFATSMKYLAELRMAYVASGGEFVLKNSILLLG